MTPTHPDDLAGDQLVARTQGDALQLADLIRDHGPDAISQILNAWGDQHTRRVAIALAAAVNPAATLGDLWGWLGEPLPRPTVTVPLSELWKHRDPHVGDDRHNSRPRRISPETRARMAERARALADKRRSA